MGLGYKDFTLKLRFVRVRPRFGALCCDNPGILEIPGLSQQWHNFALFVVAFKPRYTYQQDRKGLTKMIWGLVGAACSCKPHLR